MHRKVELPSIVENVLSIISDVAKDFKMPFLIIGASARDIVMTEIYGLKPERATKDIDLGVAVKSWNHFEKLKTSLLLDQAAKKTNVPHRIIIHGIKVDFIPFGGVEDQHGTITWPDSNGVKMSIVGFNETLKNSIELELKNGTLIKVANLAGLVVLKLISWNDRPQERPQDAEDIFYIMTHYFDAGGDQRIYDTSGENSDICNIQDFTVEKAGSVLLGRDISSMFSVKTCNLIRKIVTRELQSSKSNLIRKVTTHGVKRDDCSKLLSALITGLDAVKF